LNPQAAAASARAAIATVLHDADGALGVTNATSTTTSAEDDQIWFKDHSAATILRKVTNVM